MVNSQAEQNQPFNFTVETRPRKKAPCIIDSSTVIVSLRGVIISYLDLFGLVGLGRLFVYFLSILSVSACVMCCVVVLLNGVGSEKREIECNA